MSHRFDNQNYTRIIPIAQNFLSNYVIISYNELHLQMHCICLSLHSLLFKLCIKLRNFFIMLSLIKPKEPVFFLQQFMELLRVETEQVELN